MAMAAVLFSECATTKSTPQKGPDLTLDIANDILDSIPWDKDNGWISSEWSNPDEILSAFYDKGFRFVNYSETTDFWPIDYAHDPDEDMYYYYKTRWSFKDTYIRITGEHDYVDEDGDFVETLIALVFVRTADDYTHTILNDYGSVWNSFEFYRDGNFYEWVERP
jgi:hypothetical protein